MASKLTGDELLDFVRENAHFGQSYVIEKAGYFSMRGGKLGLKRNEYTQAIQEANGIVMGPTITNRQNNRQPTFRVRSSKRNVIPLSGCYSEMLGIQPGETVDIERFEDDQGTIHLDIVKHVEVPETTGACAILA